MTDTSCNFSECSYNPSPISQLPCLVSGSVFLLLAFYFRIRGVWMENSDFVLAAAMGLGLLGVSFLLLVGWRCLNQKLCFCDTYVSRYNGILSTNLRTSRLLYQHVRGVEIEQSILGRLFNLGDIHVGSDNLRSSAEIVIRGVRCPEAIKDELLRRVEEAQRLERITAEGAAQLATNA